jgi:hypothetical protein
MSKLFDDVARIVASPISRRQALRLVSGAVGGALLTSLGLARASQGGAASGITCPNGSSACTDAGAYCCAANQSCCQGKCCTPTAICCNGKCCKPGPSLSNPCEKAKCAKHKMLEGAAIAAGAGGGAAATALALTSGAAKPPCPSGQTVCGTTCCSNGQTCCEPLGAKCCSPGRVCCAGPSGTVLCCAAGPSPSSPCVGATKCT